jgi:hypothetical protein
MKLNSLFLFLIVSMFGMLGTPEIRAQEALQVTKIQVYSGSLGTSPTAAVPAELIELYKPYDVTVNEYSGKALAEVSVLRMDGDKEATLAPPEIPAGLLDLFRFRKDALEQNEKLVNAFAKATIGPQFSRNQQDDEASKQSWEQFQTRFRQLAPDLKATYLGFDPSVEEDGVEEKICERTVLIFTTPEALRRKIVELISTTAEADIASTGKVQDQQLYVLWLVGMFRTPGIVSGGGPDGLPEGELTPESVLWDVLQASRASRIKAAPGERVEKKLPF